MGRLGYIARCIAHMDYGALFDTVGEVHERSGKNRAGLFVDIVKCGFKFGAGYKDYLLLEFETMTDAQRATFVTRGVNNSIVKMLNDLAYCHIFDNKNECYTVLSDGEANAVYACIRMGNSDRPADNINAGGMYSPIDMETGKIAGLACDKQFRVYEAHPRTGTVLMGYQIPMWDEVIACAARRRTWCPRWATWDGTSPSPGTARCSSRPTTCPATMRSRRCPRRLPIRSVSSRSCSVTSRGFSKTGSRPSFSDLR